METTMSNTTNTIFIENLQELRAEWLKDFGTNEDDVLEDEKGEYIKVENEDGFKTQYLPKEFNYEYHA